MIFTEICEQLVADAQASYRRAAAAATRGNHAAARREYATARDTQHLVEISCPDCYRVRLPRQGV